MAVEGLQVKELNDVLNLTDSVINKKYLSFLSNQNIYQLRDLRVNELATDVKKHTRIFHLRKFVYDSDENFLHKLISVVNVAYALKGTVITSIHSNGECVDFYIGIVAKEKKGAAGEKDREALLNAFEGTIVGNFNGSDIGTSIKDTELEKFCEALEGNAICSVSVVPSLRNNDKGGIVSYVQGIENLVDSLKGKKYTLVTSADPIAPSDIQEIRHGYESIYNYLVPLYKVVKTTGTTESLTLSQTDTQNYVKGITEGISRTQSKSDSISYSNGFNLGVSFIVSAGFNHSKQHATMEGEAFTEQNTRNEQFGNAHAESTGVGKSTSDSTQISVENRIIKSMLDKIEKNIERIDECEGYGAFNAATYIIADEKETALNVAGNFTSLMKGERSSTQVSEINCWEKEKPSGRNGSSNGNDATFDKLLNYIKHFTHPTFKVNENVSVSTSAMVSGPELTVQLGFPKKSISGLVVTPMHPFGRNINKSGDSVIELGQLYYMGQLESQKVELDVNSLTSHAFVTGSTGTGKSNAIYGIINEMSKKGIHFMIVEPAKGEYKNVFGARKDVRVLGTNNKKTELLQINPFAFNEDVHVLEHIDRLIEIFNVCWSMYAAMPAVLKEAVEEAYISCGWDLDVSENRFGSGIFPTFSDLQIALEKVIERSAYDEEVKSNYKGSLLTRVRSLTNGLNGRIFCTNAIEDSELFDSNVIVDLSRVGALDTKALIMGILVIKLQEHRMYQGDVNSKLKHVTVLEEAHNILKKTSTEQTSEGSNMIGKSVEMLTNAIAEMRTYGEGFIIADQAPGLMDMAVIRNTNTKIILRTPEYSDRVLVGRAAGLNEGQVEEVAKFPKGVAAVYQNGWLEPVLCKFDRYDFDDSVIFRKEETVCRFVDKKVRTELVKWLLYSRLSEKTEPDFSVIEANIDSIAMASQVKIGMKQLMNKNERLHAWDNYRFASLAKLVVEVLDCDKKIESFLNNAMTVDDMQKAMCELQKTILEDGIHKSLELEINHCFMRYYSKGGKEELKKYYEWDYQIRNRLM